MIEFLSKLVFYWTRLTSYEAPADKPWLKTHYEIGKIISISVTAVSPLVVLFTSDWIVFVLFSGAVVGSLAGLIRELLQGKDFNKQDFFLTSRGACQNGALFGAVVVVAILLFSMKS